MSSQKMIKVWIPVRLPNEQISNEHLWATPINKHTVKIENIPFFADLAMGDLVEIDSQCQILRVIEHCGKTRRGQYDWSRSTEENQRVWDIIREHLSKFDIAVEGMGNGIFSMAVPLDLTDRKLQEIIVACPEPFSLFEI